MQSVNLPPYLTLKSNSYGNDKSVRESLRDAIVQSRNECSGEDRCNLADLLELVPAADVEELKAFSDDSLRTGW
jgi:hypothetical protein